MKTDAGSNLLAGWIARAAHRAPQKPWVIGADSGRSFSYGRLHDVIGRFATLLYQRGIVPNDRVALLGNNSIEYLLCYFGVMAAGATVCTINVDANRNQLVNILTRLQPGLIVYQDGLQLDDQLATIPAPRLRLGQADSSEPGTLFAELARCAAGETQPPAKADDDAVILFTSGTSARPKGVVLNFREYLLNIDPLVEGFGITGEDRLYDFRPFSWASAQLLGALAPVNCGATLVLGERFSAHKFFDHIRDRGVSVAAGNPTTISILLGGQTGVTSDQVPSLRFVTSSSAPLTLELWRRFEQKFGIPIAQGYGASEANWIAAVPGGQRRLGTVGRPFAYHDLAIVDAEGRRLPAGELGQIELGGFADHPYRYLGDDGSIEIHSRGRIRTGDIGRFDADGFLMVTGREKELIIRGGAKISPLEIDSCLMEHADLVEAATIGVPDAVYGEEVVSYVVLRPGADLDAEEILHYCRSILPAFKAPKRILVSPSLPKTERGKLDRRALLRQWNAGGNNIRS